MKRANRETYLSVTSISEAKSKFRGFYETKQTIVYVPLESCKGRVLAKDISSPLNIPIFDRSTVDGYAVRAKGIYLSTDDSPVSLDIIDHISAGLQSQIRITKDSEAIEIATGCPIPDGADAIVMVEYTDVVARGEEGDISRIDVYRPSPPGRHIVSSGSDIKQSSFLFSKGTRLETKHIAVLAAIGLEKIAVYRRAKVGIISTGDEIVPPGSAILPGKLFDVNSYSLFGRVLDDSGEPKLYSGIVPDDPEELREAIQKFHSECDMVLISGGTSAGRGDYLHEVINEMGSPGVVVHGVALKPGKPCILAVVEGKAIFGLPGFPSSVLFTYDTFVSPLIQEIAGVIAKDGDKKSSRRMLCRSGTTLQSPLGRQEFKLVHLVYSELLKDFVTYSLPGGSSSISTFVKADGYIIIPEDVQNVEAGAIVEVERLDEKEIEPAFVVFGHLNARQVRLLNLFQRKWPSIHTKIVEFGERGLVRSLLKKEGSVGIIQSVLPPESIREHQSLRSTYEDLETYAGANQEIGILSHKAKGIDDEKKVVEGLLARQLRLVSEFKLLDQNEIAGMFLQKLNISESQAREIDDEMLYVSTDSEGIRELKIDENYVMIGFSDLAHDNRMNFTPLGKVWDYIITWKGNKSTDVKRFLSMLESEEY